MISRILIRDFQNQRKLDLPLDQITTICGPTDAGKSSVLRALLWVCRNQPSGTEFIRHGRKRASVQIKVGKHRITRDRGGRNHYFLDGVKFAAFKSAVPEAVAAVLNVGAVNFQEQDDPRFWLSLSPGELSKELNRLIQLDIGDRAVAYLAGRLRSARAERAVLIERRDEAKLALARLRDVPRMAQDAERIFTLETRLQSTQAKRRQLAHITQQGRTVAQASRNAAKALNRAGKLAQTGAELTALRSKTARLRGLVGDAVKSRCFIAAPLPGIDRLQRIRESADAFAERNRTLRSLLDDAKESRRVLCQLRNELDAAQALMEQLKPRQRITCPKCRHVFSLSPSPTCTSRPKYQGAALTETGTRRKQTTSTNSTP